MSAKYEFDQGPAQRFAPIKFDRYWRKIAPLGAVMGLAGQEPIGSSLSSLTAVGEELHP